MNDGSGASRDTQRRARFRLDALTAVAVCILVLVAACGGSSGTSGSGSAKPPTLQSMTSKALAYAQCMRSHGISNYPAVNNGRNIQIGPGPSSGIDTHSARFKAAQKDCYPLLPNGGP
jgi:hypothetical protein